MKCYSFRRTILFTLAILAINMAQAFAQSEANEDLAPKFPDEDFIIIGSGPIDGVYYPTGGGICRIINGNNIGTRCAVESTAGSIYNLQALRDADIDLAIVQSDLQRRAYFGMSPLTYNFRDLRYLFSLHDEALTIIVRSDSNIQNLSDLKKKNIAVDNTESGTNSTIKLLMQIKNWTEESFKSIKYITTGAQAEALCNQEVDAIVSIVGHPNGNTQDITSTCETRILSIDPSEIDTFMRKNPEYSYIEITGGMYRGVLDRVLTFGPKAVVVTTADMSDKLAYEITAVVLNNLQKFKRLHTVFSSLDIEEMAKGGRAIPYHPGALQFFREQDLLPKVEPLDSSAPEEDQQDNSSIEEDAGQTDNPTAEEAA